MSIYVNSCENNDKKKNEKYDLDWNIRYLLILCFYLCVYERYDFGVSIMISVRAS